MQRLRLRRFVPPDGCFHIARVHYAPMRPAANHRQDFPELFWVEVGRGWHLVNGRRVPLAPGDVVFVRPTDEHSFRAGGRHGLTFVNVAFAADLLDHLHQRYFPDDAGWPWTDNAIPTQWRISRSDIALLGSLANELSMTAQRRLDFEHLLLTLLRMQPAVGAGQLSGTEVPAWLPEALDRLEHEPDQATTPARLAACADRSVEHVNRTVRRCFGITTTQWLNQRRLDAAARLLRMTNRPIIVVAADCGYENLGYFYKRFTERFSQTPRRYRLAGQAIAR